MQKHLKTIHGITKKNVEQRLNGLKSTIVGPLDNAFLKQKLSEYELVTQIAWEKQLIQMIVSCQLTFNFVENEDF